MKIKRIILGLVERTEYGVEHEFNLGFEKIMIAIFSL